MYTTEQERFWAGDFGDDYIKRNYNIDVIENNVAFFSKILAHTGKIESVIEFGSNIGINLMAIKKINANCECTAIEINKNAAESLKNNVEGVNIINTSILECNIQRKYDLSFTKGVLIHLNPDSLNLVYDKLYNSSSKFILIAEYYNPTPVTIEYRGNKNKLFKRDFAGELLERYKDLELVDYGFLYHNDKAFKQDDLTWFLMRKL